jgi:hypothetical protein
MDLHQALAELEATADSFVIRSGHQLADAFVRLCAADVIDYARASLTLSEGSEAHTAFATARAAYEAAQDVAYVASRDAAAYDEAGALAYVVNFFETVRLRDRLQKGGEENEIELSTEGRTTVAQVVAQEVERLNALSPGSGDTLQAAFDAVLASEKSYRKHWSRLQRPQMAEKIHEAWPDSGLTPKAMDALYGKLSVIAHPGFKSHLRRYTIREDGTLELVADHRNPDEALRLALLAVFTALECFRCLAAI